MKQLTIRSLSGLAVIAIASLALVQLASARTDHATATTIRVSGGEFFFRLSAKSVATPRKVTFVFKNVGHVVHDFKINGRTTPLIQPGRQRRSSSRSRRSATTPTSAPCPDMPPRG